MAESKYAHSVVFRQAEELIFVPGQKPGYNNAGYRDCYKFKDTDIYFEDYDQTISIDNIDQWRSQGGAGYLNPLGIDFNAYRETVLAQCDLMFDRGDRPEIAQLTSAAKTKIENYLYDVSLSMSSNKAKVDEIYNQLVADTDALALPVPEPWIPPTPVDPENTGTSQTGDSLPLWAGILLAAVAAAAGIVA
ncbi:MAG: hypothetical protein Q4F54_00405 [Coriobacteriia bacterium]|nr:hypothetical protein [Coriobacteriia bacterium]